MEFDYYYGSQAEQFSFYRLPKSLIKDKQFKRVSSDAKILYGIMLDRMSLSIKNHWVDGENRVYIIFTLEDVMNEFECSERKASYLMSELDTKSGIGLIEKKRQGLGKPNLIYLKNFLVQKDYSYLSQDNDVQEATGEVLQIQSCKNMQEQSGKDVQIKTGTDMQVQSCKNLQVKSCKNEQVKSSTDMQVQSSTGLQNKSCNSLPPSYTNINDTDYSNTNPINLSCDESIQGRMDGMEEIRIYTEIVKENIDYDILLERSSIGDRGYIDEIVELMVETICIKRDYVKIAGADYPYQLVKGKLLKVDSSHIEYVLESLHNNTTKVRNIKSYLLTSIYNAPSTIDSYYRAEVNHDMYGIN